MCSEQFEYHQTLSANTLSVGYGLSFVGQSIAYSFPKHQGAKLRQDLDKSGALYGAELGNREIVESNIAARKLLRRC
jgi:hypothetical protein